MEHIINKKLVFDAVRVMLGRGFSQDEIDSLDRALDVALALPSASSSRRLGALSERFESGDRGPGAVSSGQGDPGGVSYGIWQLSSRAGTAAAFVAGEGARWRTDFRGAAPGTPAFSAAWRAIAVREPAAFTEAQHAFIARTHYGPAVVAVRQRSGLDLDTRHAAVRDATWSVAVQHGGAAKILADAVARADAALARAEPGYDRSLVEAIYAERGAYVLRVAARAGGAQRRLLEAVTRNRYPAELAAALALFASSTTA
ncbi:hypothetical protein [Novosphingobium sp. JCM 18896]|uniref:VgrG-related protein n=1 Tax=Novosphingobium sp. JCM 18896 TaxID=2989731 RepID=UPI002223BED4|nr:hypothetical protein [Novosphingobium sp. JCM 18896]MCW1430361.1 hypothetical protein [Novosphingobium sp. JCM 18896]